MLERFCWRSVSGSSGGRRRWLRAVGAGLALTLLHAAAHPLVHGGRVAAEQPAGPHSVLATSAEQAPPGSDDGSSAPTPHHCDFCTQGSTASFGEAAQGPAHAPERTEPGWSEAPRETLDARLRARNTGPRAPPFQPLS